MRILCFLAVLLAIPSAAPAAIIITYVGGTVTAGGLGTVDVMVSSNAAQATPDLLDSFSAHFRITPLGASPPSGLQFSNPQSDSQLSDPGYVFFGDSISPPPIGLVTSAVNTNDDYVGGDATISMAGVPIHQNNGSFLLFRLNIDATLANLGNQFQIELKNDGGTQFFDPSFGGLTLDGNSFNPFTITAVPEPGSFLLLAGGLALYLKRRRRTSQVERRDAAC